MNLLCCSPYKTYTINQIEDMIDSKRLRGCDVKLYFPDFPTCSCTQCIIDTNNFINYIKKKLILKSDKPTCEYFEYYQKPTEILSIDID
jgi:hypothetical protein